MKAISTSEAVVASRGSALAIPRDGLFARLAATIADPQSGAAGSLRPRLPVPGETPAPVHDPFTQNTDVKWKAVGPAEPSAETLRFEASSTATQPVSDNPISDEPITQVLQHVVHPEDVAPLLPLDSSLVAVLAPAPVLQHDERGPVVPAVHLARRPEPAEPLGLQDRPQFAINLTETARPPERGISETPAVRGGTVGARQMPTIARPLVPHARRDASSLLSVLPSAPAAPTIEIQIGRIELRGSAAAAIVQPSAASAARPTPSLSAYLARRSRGVAS